MSKRLTLEVMYTDLVTFLKSYCSDVRNLVILVPAKLLVRLFGECVVCSFSECALFIQFMINSTEEMSQKEQSEDEEVPLMLGQPLSDFLLQLEDYTPAVRF